MYYQQHMPAGQPPAPQPVSSGYHHQAQPTLLQPGPGQYPPPSTYSQYGTYGAGGLTSPPSAGASVPNNMGPQTVLPLPSVNQQMPNQYSGFDTTGQVAPPGMKPRVTATLWEDEGSLCFQVEARGICVARREDNHMINGTKLLNVAGMTRGRRDGILKSEKVRHVVKIGPMHLKGVWIPFERALDFANKEKITELLYPLFVHNIGALLYHPTNQNRTTQVMAAAERRKLEAGRTQQNPPMQQAGLPSIGQHHHHGMITTPNSATQPSLPSQSPMSRPSMDRAHTFPTPPASASGVMQPGMGSSESFSWSQQGMSGGQGTNPPMSIDTSLSNAARSMPATPATTPPGTSLQSMQQYPPASQPYDNSRSMYNNPPPHQSPYQPAQTSPQDRPMYGGQSTYIKSEMGPPSGRPAGTGPEQDDAKPNGMMHHQQGGQPVSHAGEEEAEHEHDAEYTHDSGYDANRAPYNYSAPPVQQLPSEHPHMSPEMNSGSGHQAASGRSTPRSAAAPQPYYSAGYSTPPRQPAQSSSLYNVMSNDRGAPNGGSADVYAPQADMGASMQNGYGAPVMNGGASMKRGRDDEEERPGSGGPGMDLKRRKTLMDGTVPSPMYNNNAPMSRPASAIATQQRR